MPTSAEPGGESSRPPRLSPTVEGGTSLELPTIAVHRGPAPRAAVFYNPAMALDRDLNVALASVAARHGYRGIAGWEMLGATGVRGLRLAHETELFGRLVISELSPSALEVTRRNAAVVAPDRVEVRGLDARTTAPDGRFAYVDLDPYGSPLPFLTSALDAAEDRAILAVTATDMMVLAGVTRGACERLYGARPIRGRLAPEAGLRILMARVATFAEARGRSVRPLLSYVHDHHVRTYLELGPARSEAGELPIELIEPAGWAGPPIPGTGPFGPLWTGPLGDPAWVRELESPEHPARGRESARFLERLREEAEVDVPFYYEPNELAQRLELHEPPSIAALLAGLTVAGARAARGHPREGAIRTTASRGVVDEVARRVTTRA